MGLRGRAASGEGPSGGPLRDVGSAEVLPGRLSWLCRPLPGSQAGSAWTPGFRGVCVVQGRPLLLPVLLA